MKGLPTSLESSTRLFQRNWMGQLASVGIDSSLLPTRSSSIRFDKLPLKENLRPKLLRACSIRGQQAALSKFITPQLIRGRHCSTLLRQSSAFWLPRVWRPKLSEMNFFVPPHCPSVLRSLWLNSWRCIGWNACPFDTAHGVVMKSGSNDTCSRVGVGFPSQMCSHALWNCG